LLHNSLHHYFNKSLPQQMQVLEASSFCPFEALWVIIADNHFSLSLCKDTKFSWHSNIKGFEK